jgi:peptidoglycan/xylan/chitin deacetylase (PgdA/CDA1 family)
VGITCEFEMMNKTLALTITGFLISFSVIAAGQVGHTEIAKWQYGKNGAVSLTYDDGSINQFRVAVPIMDSLGLPATFFIITGEMPGARYHGTFIGRPTKEIIEETAAVPTNKDNFFERASAIRFLGDRETRESQTQAGELYDEGNKLEEAYRVIDTAYAKVRRGDLKPQVHHKDSNSKHVTWEELSAMAARGHEIASHTVTHPRLAVLDDANVVYELEKSREDILEHLGFKHTFSVECPYGTENDRAVQAALLRYPASRNYMPDSFVDDLDRGSETDPTTSSKEYVRWQRGALTKTPMPVLKSWIDTTAAHGNIWLALVFHGVDGIGWEPTTGPELKEYFNYLKSKEDKLWVATFQDVAKYMRERMHSTVASYREGDEISVVLRDDLKDVSYDLPLTLKTQVPTDWKTALVRQGARSARAQISRENGNNYVLYQAVPNGENVTLAK